MFKNRKLTVTVDKLDKDQAPQAHQDPKSFERKTEVILSAVNSLGAKMFLGVCVYILLDTHRQVAVARANNPK